MYNTIMQSSFLLIGANSQTIRFEANMLRSLGVKSVRGIFDIKAYLQTIPEYPIDAMLIHENCSLCSGVDFIKKMRFEHMSTVPMILLFSSPPNIQILQILESIHTVPLVRPYTRQDIQRALVQAKRLVKTFVEDELIATALDENPIVKKDGLYEKLVYKTGNNTFLLSIVHFQFFLKSGLYEDAAKMFLDIKDILSEKRLLKLIQRTTAEIPNANVAIEQFCNALADYEKKYSEVIRTSLIQSEEQKIIIKKLSERKTRNITNTVYSGMHRYVK